jgi:1,4-alpha-glucan branching enzyme
MPYVEGFGTYPFGEEWLFDAYARSHLPVLDLADRLTMTVTPVLADQLEADGVEGRLLEFLRRHRLGAAEIDVSEKGDTLVAAQSEAAAVARAVETIECCEGDLLQPFRAAQDEGRVELMTSAATHAVFPLLATKAGGRLQVDAGLRSHIRRFGRPAGFWLPECAVAPGLDELLAERGLLYTCLDQTRSEPDGAALRPILCPSGCVGFTIDWPMVDLVWGSDGYPADSVYLDFHRQSMNGTRLWDIGGDAYDPERAREQAVSHAAEFCRAVAERLSHLRSATGDRGLCVFAIDTELLGHWWREGPWWLEGVIASAESEGLDLLRLSEALEAHDPEAREIFTSSWGEGKDLSTWGSPAVADIARAARRSELALVARALASGADGPASERAARELLALQSSDWAFIDYRGQAGDYAFDRAVAHAQSLLEAVESPHMRSERLRNLAPDLSLAPLLEP